MTTPLDPTAFHELEHSGWESVAGPYDEAFGGLTTQVVEPLLDAARVTQAQRVLDVATGPGYVADAAARRGAAVTAIDFSSAMVNIARVRHPGLDIRVGDAAALAFEDAAFDAVVMNFGILHLARPDQAIREAARVLRAGGRLAFTAWAPPDRSLAFRIILEALQSHGDPDVPLPPGPPFFRFADADECRVALFAAGFATSETRRLDLEWQFPSADALLENFVRTGVRTRAMLLAQTPDALAAIRSAVRAAASRYGAPDGSGRVLLPMGVMLTAGVRA
jgi:SAM-dependent methyltransferase